MSDVAQVAPGVYTVPHRVVAGKMGLIVGSRRSVAVDCGSDDAEGQALLDLARAGGRAPDWIVYTHGHSDHAGGSAPFRARRVTAIAHVAAPGVLRRLAEGRAARSGRRPKRSPPGCCGRRCSSRGSSGWTSAGAPPASSPLPDTARIRPASSWSGRNPVRRGHRRERHPPGLRRRQRGGPGGHPAPPGRTGGAVLVPGHGAVLRGPPPCGPG